MDDDISAKLFDAYFKALDPHKLYFIEGDINNFSNYRYLLDDLLRHGQIEFAYDVYEMFVNRAMERLAYVESRLQAPFDFSINEMHQPDRSKQSWCKSREELDEIWRLRGDKSPTLWHINFYFLF